MPVAYLLNKLGDAHKAKCDYPAALRYHKQHLQLAEEMQDNQHIAVAAQRVGIALKSTGDYAGAKQMHEKDLKIALETGDVNGEATARNNIGASLLSQGDYAGAEAELGGLRQERVHCVQLLALRLPTL